MIAEKLRESLYLSDEALLYVGAFAWEGTIILNAPSLYTLFTS